MTKLLVLAALLVLAGSALATVGRRQGTLTPTAYRRVLGLAVVVLLWTAAAAVRGRLRFVVAACAIGATWLLVRSVLPARSGR